MAKYALNTNVSIHDSKSEIDRILKKYGATDLKTGQDKSNIFIMFDINAYKFKFTLPMPNKKDLEFTHTPIKKIKRDKDLAIRIWHQACKQRYRVLILMVRAKLESLDIGAFVSKSRLWHELFYNDCTCPKSKGEYLVDIDCKVHSILYKKE